MRKSALFVTLLLLALLVLAAARAEAEPDATEASTPVVAEATGWSFALVEGFEKARREFFVQHLHEVANVPEEYGRYAWDAATALGEDPYDLASMLISEHSGRRFDFTPTTAAAYERPITYEADAEGKDGEIGLYQQKEYWVRKARKYYGTDWKAEDLYDPWINTQVAAFQVMHAKRSHGKKCAGSLHDWMAHWKCGRHSRDGFAGQCGYSQRKFLKLRESLLHPEVTPKELKKLGKDRYKHFEEKLENQYKTKYRAKRRKLRKRLKKLCEENEFEVPSNLKRMSVEDLERELYLREGDGEGGQ